MYQCRFTNCNKCCALMRDVDSGGGSAWWGQGVYRISLYLLSVCVCMHMYTYVIYKYININTYIYILSNKMNTFLVSLKSNCFMSIIR